MNRLVTVQTLLFLTSIKIGIFMGIVFDLIRIFRKLLKHPNFLVQVEDMLYWVFCGFMGFYMLYICNYAAIRPFVFVGIILGATFYFLAFSSWFMKLATIAIYYIKTLLARLICLVSKPCKWLLGILVWPVYWLGRKYRQLRWHGKLAYRRRRRLRYEQKMDQKVDDYLKKGRT